MKASEPEVRVFPGIPLPSGTVKLTKSGPSCCKRFPGTVTVMLVSLKIVGVRFVPLTDTVAAPLAWNSVPIRVRVNGPEFSYAEPGLMLVSVGPVTCQANVVLSETPSSMAPTVTV